MKNKKNEIMAAEQEMNDKSLPVAQSEESGELSEMVQQEEKDCTAENKAAEEMLRREMKKLLELYPQLREQMKRGEGLPQWLLAACAKDGVSLREAYAEHEAQQAKEEAAQLRRELEMLKQNAAASGRAPVKGAAGNTGEKGKDPFLEGLLSDE